MHLDVWMGCLRLMKDSAMSSTLYYVRPQFCTQRLETYCLKKPSS